MEEKWKDEEIEGPVVENDDNVDVEFVEEEYDNRENFMLQRLLLASKDKGQHKNLF